MNGAPAHDSHGNETVTFCIVLPPKVNSTGVWENTSSQSVILNYSLPLLELQMLLIFLVTHVIYSFLEPLGIPLFASQMVAGMILGPAMLGQIDEFKVILFPPDFGVGIIDTTAIFGFAIFLFLMGVKMDVKVAFRTTRSAKVIGLLSLLAPTLVGCLVREVFKEPNQTEEIRIERLVGTTIESLTSLSVIACLLSELKILNSELRRLALSSAVLGDLRSLFLVVVIVFSKNWSKSHSVALTNAGAMVDFIIVLVFVLRPLMVWIVRETPEGRPIKEVYIFAIMLIALGSSMYTHCFNQSPLFGAFLFGLAVPDGPPLGSALVDKFECFVSGVFLTLYVTTATMRADPGKMFCDPTRLKFSAILVVTTFLAKFIACLIPSFFGKMPFKDSLAFALIMTSKGIVELSHLSTYKDRKCLLPRSNCRLLQMQLFIVPILVKSLYDSLSRKYAGYLKRNIMHLTPNAELRVLACVHRPENFAGFIDLLNATCPTIESPNVVYVLHLVENGPCHSGLHSSLEARTRVGSSFENFILAFNQYEQNNWGLVTVNAFTAISPPNLMHDDICTMALDKQTSLILLPFHRKRSIDGSLEAEHNVIRNLNCSVLERSPCSISILVDRGALDRRISRTSLKSSRSFYCICMIFFGGKDDREALTLAKRMAKDPTVNLTVIHLVAEVSRNVLDWDMMLDAEELKNIKQREGGDGKMTYMEEVVKDGPQAALVVRSIADGYNLIIVGRRYGVESVQTSGLSEWSEFPELGIIGDLLASTDLERRSSVLVTQQQHYFNRSRTALHVSLLISILLVTHGQSQPILHCSGLVSHPTSYKVIPRPSFTTFTNLASKKIKNKYIDAFKIHG
ncbi:LOW QUALITY PROTEIN: cation/H(+) antiporter 12-like [Durio zibethinus]|uniref:LOW QUALITY PROTEIN: cation/H(+) antiporter 12-like n=1 Tax=Durio zibethinus TaxID=66656 RepID=A0A6P5XVA7_DURZI|nr:LOW QUALITY PROTEIN: cation/H(+) antiporter 12-like [Durio zibethinus]